LHQFNHPVLNGRERTENGKEVKETASVHREFNKGGAQLRREKVKVIYIKVQRTTAAVTSKKYMVRGSSLNSSFTATPVKLKKLNVA